MDDTTATSASPDPSAEDLTLVALTPADMMPAQTELVTWCDRKIAAVKAELSISKRTSSSPPSTAGSIAVSSPP